MKKTKLLVSFWPTAMELNFSGFLLCRVIPFAMASFPYNGKKGHSTKFISSWQAIRIYLHASGNEPSMHVNVSCIHTVFFVNEC